MGTGSANYASGDFGTSPFFGQLSGNPQPASNYISVGSESKAQWFVENLVRGGGQAGLVGGDVVDGVGGAPSQKTILTHSFTHQHIKSAGLPRAANCPHVHA